MAGQQGDHNYRRARPPALRVMERVEVDEEGCWLWPGALRQGYGAVMTGSRRDGDRRVRDCHLVTWEHFEGAVPEGLELDHLCRVRHCCNPGHLEPVTSAENTRRAMKHLSDIERARRSACMTELNRKRWAA